MTKKETEMLLEAVKNAPIENGQITVTVLGATFTFGSRFMLSRGGVPMQVTEENRNEWIERIKKRCNARLMVSITKRELDAPGLKHQNRIVEKMLYKYIYDNNLVTSKYSESFYFVLDGGEYKFISREDKYKAIEYAKSIGKNRNDVFCVQS